MTVSEKFKLDSMRAAIRALRGLEQTARMLEKWAPEVFPEVNAQGQKHFGRVMMEAAAETIRESWAQAIKEVEQSDKLLAVAREIEARVRPTICPTWSSDGGDQGQQGRISLEDFETLILLAAGEPATTQSEVA